MIRVVIADDHPLFRQGLKQALESCGITIVAEASNGREALDRLRLHCPHVAVLDIDMPVMDGFDVVRAAQEEGLEARVVFLTLHKDEIHLDEALELGVQGYVLKDSPVNEIGGCIQAVQAGRSYVSPALTPFLLKRRRQGPESRAQGGDAVLTATERRVLLHLAQYKTSKEIATAVGVSVRTVEKHRANICDKLNLHGSHALVKYAVSRLPDL